MNGPGTDLHRPGSLALTVKRELSASSMPLAFLDVPDDRRRLCGIILATVRDV